MADVPQTPANVTIIGDTAEGRVTTEQIDWGEAIVRGNWIYENTQDETGSKADVSGQSTAKVKGMAITGGSAGHSGIIATSGDVDVGGTLVAGKAYVLSTSGGMAPADDLATGDWLAHLGYALTTSKFRIAIKIHNVQIP